MTDPASAAMLGAVIAGVAAIGRPRWVMTGDEWIHASLTFVLALLAVATARHWAGALAYVLRPLAWLLGAPVLPLVALATAGALAVAIPAAVRLEALLLRTR